MSNTILTHQMVARRSAKRLQEAMNFITNISREREDDMTAKVNGYRKGGTVKIKIPPANKVYDGAVFAGGGAAPDQVETYVTSTLSTQKHVALRFTSIEKALSIDEYDERFIRPAISTLAAVVQADQLSKIYKQIAGVVGTAGTVPTTMKTYSQARSYLERFLAPADPRTLLISSDANTELVDASKVLLNPNKAISDMFMQGYINSGHGFNWFENQSLPIHTNGNKVAGLTVSGAGQTGSNLLIAGTLAADTFKAGTSFQIAGVYAVHPLTGAILPKLRDFVVTADVTAAGATTTLAISPALNATAPGATVSALPANGAAITIQGAASTSYRQNLAFHRDAIVTAFAPLGVIAGTEGYTFDADGISLRVMTGGDFTNDAENTRIDVLYADPQLVYKDHAVRITE